MIVGILVIVWVLVLRNMDKKRQLEERQKAGLVSPGPANFETLRRTLGGNFRAAHQRGERLPTVGPAHGRATLLIAILGIIYCFGGLSGLHQVPPD